MISNANTNIKMNENKIWNNIYIQLIIREDKIKEFSEYLHSYLTNELLF